MQSFCSRVVSTTTRTRRPTLLAPLLLSGRRTARLWTWSSRWRTWSAGCRRSLLQGAPLAGLLSVAFKLMVDSVDFPIFTCPFCSLEVDSDSSFCKLHRAMAGILHSWLGIKFFHAGFLFFMMPQIESSLECS